MESLRKCFVTAITSNLSICDAMCTTVYKFSCASSQFSSENVQGMFSPGTVIKLTWAISHEHTSAISFVRYRGKINNWNPRAKGKFQAFRYWKQDVQNTGKCFTIIKNCIQTIVTGISQYTRASCEKKLEKAFKCFLPRFVNQNARFYSIMRFCN